MPASFVYFIPRNVTAPIQNEEQLREAGLGYILPIKPGIVSVHTVSGPGGLAGSLVSTDGTPPVFDGEKQKWHKGIAGNYWVGCYNDNKPTPDDLLRDRVIDGTPVELMDGNHWIVPICVPNVLGGSEASGSTLPVEYDLDEGNNLVARTQKKYLPIAERCYQYFQQYMGWVEDPMDKATQENRRMTQEELEIRRKRFFERIDLASDLLSINYKVSKVEVVSLLVLFGSDYYGKVLSAAIEQEAIDAEIGELAKKLQASEDSATEHGPIGGGTTETTNSDTSN